MIESHLALVYLPRGSATAWLNRPDGLTRPNPYTLEGTGEERRREKKRGLGRKGKEKKGKDDISPHLASERRCQLLLTREEHECLKG